MLKCKERQTGLRIFFDFWLTRPVTRRHSALRVALRSTRTPKENLRSARTTFIISHRLSMIRRADQILALADGCVVERGTHERFLAAGLTYAHLYERQHIAAL